MSAPLRIEKVDDRIRKARELVKCSGDWLSLDEPNLAEQYERRKLDIVVRRSLPEKTKYGFLIRSHPPSREGREIIFDEPQSHHLETPGPHGNIYKAAMLPFDVELMECPKRFIPSVIRLQRFDDVAVSPGELLYEFVTRVIASDESGLVPGHRKIDFFAVKHAMASCKSIGQDVETASDNIDIGANFDIERSGESRFFDSYYGVVSRWRWQIFDSYINILTEPGFDPLVEGWDLGLGPINSGFSV